MFITLLVAIVTACFLLINTFCEQIIRKKKDKVGIDIREVKVYPVGNTLTVVRKHFCFVKKHFDVAFATLKVGDSLAEDD